MTGYLVREINKSIQKFSRLIETSNRIMSLSLPFRKLVICGCLAVVSPVLVHADPNLNPDGLEYPIIGSLAGDQSSAQVAWDPSGINGGYLVWQDNSLTTRGLRIKACHLGAGFTPDGSPITVSSAWKSRAAGDQEKPQVACFSDGGGVVVWQGGKVGSQKIYARFFSANGKAIRSDVRVSRRTRKNQVDPSVAVLTDGSVLVVWSSYGVDDPGNSNASLRGLQGVFAQRFSATGARLGKEFQVNQYYQHNQRNPAVAALANGGFAVVWISELYRGPGSMDVFCRVFDAQGEGANEFPVNPGTNTICANLTIASSSTGGFAIAWGQRNGIRFANPSDPNDPTGVGDPLNSDGTLKPGVSAVPRTVKSERSWDVYGYFCDANGSGVGPVLLNNYTYGDQYAPKVSALGDHYMAVWTSLAQDGSREGVFGRLFSAAGSVESPEIQINSNWVNRQYQPTVVSDGSSRFLALWSSYVAHSRVDLYVQPFVLEP